MSVKDTRQPLVTAPLPKRARPPVFTLLIAIAALGASGYVWKTSTDQLQVVKQEVQKIEAIDKRVGTLLRDQRSVQDDAAMRARTLASLQSRVDTLDQNLSADQRQQWLLAEVDHYIRLAEQHILLTRDSQGAKALLEVADRLLAAANDNQLLGLRQAVANDLLALNASNTVDTAGTYLRLSALSQRIQNAKLPLRAGGREHQGEVVADAPATEASTKSLFAQGWDKFRGLITVRQYNEPIKPLLGEADRTLILQNLELELGQAQLALMRGESAIYKAALQSARDRLARYFQQLPDSEYTALQTELNALSQIEVRPSVPDLTGSVNALNALRGKLPTAVSAPANTESTSL